MAARRHRAAVFMLFYYFQGIPYVYCGARGLRLTVCTPAYMPRNLKNSNIGRVICKIY